jgi:hypothetical protein
VSALALLPPAEARVVYTPAHVRIPQNGSVQLDLNHDGVVDFTVSSFYIHNATSLVVGLLEFRAGNIYNEVWAAATDSIFASALSANVRVGSNIQFSTDRSLYMAIVGRDYGRIYGGGPWTRKVPAYLGLKFQIAGTVHYGWARIQVENRLNPKTAGTPLLIVATLTGYAYETIPNKPIDTGKTKGADVISVQPASLGWLAQGSVGLAA